MAKRMIEVSEEYARHAMLGFNMDDPGFCLACGEEAHGVEPDAQRYPCESCGKRAVYGFSELMLMGRIEIV